MSLGRTSETRTERLDRFSLLDGFQNFQGGIHDGEVFGPGGINQMLASGNEDDFRTLKHVARHEGRAELQGIGPAQGAAIDQLTGALENRGIQRFLDGAGRLQAQNLERGGGVFPADTAGTFPAADGCMDFKWCGGRNKFAIVLDAFHQLDQGIGARLADKQLREGCGLEEIATHRTPRSSSRTAVTVSPFTATGWKRWASSGIPASARLSRMVVVG